MAGLPARLPDPLVGFLPDLRRALHLVDQHRPQALGDVVALLGVQVDRVEHRAEHVVLALVVGAVADAHRARAFVALEVLERRLLEVALARDPVHDLQRAVLVALEVRDVLDEVVGLPVEPERVQAPQRERGVAHPAVAVVPVAFAVRRLRQRRRRRRDERAGRHEREPLQRQRRALAGDSARDGRDRCRRPASRARSGSCARGTRRPARPCGGRRAPPSRRSRRSAARPRTSCDARARGCPRSPCARR